MFLIAAFALMYLGVPPVVPLRDDAHWPLVPLVSISPGISPDVLSSLPGALHILMAALQCIFLVEIARLFWIGSKTLTIGRFILTIAYEAALAIDMFQRWGRDWFVWALYQMRLSELCDLTNPCYPISGTVPWLSLFILGLLLALLMAPRAQSILNGSPT
jgi:hypothetical protein